MGLTESMTGTERDITHMKMYAAWVIDNTRSVEDRRLRVISDGRPYTSHATRIPLVVIWTDLVGAP